MCAVVWSKNCHPTVSFRRMAWYSCMRLLTPMWLVIDMSLAWICGPVTPSGTLVKCESINPGRLITRMVPSPTMAPQCLKTVTYLEMMKKMQTILSIADNHDSFDLCTGIGDLQNITVAPPRPTNSSAPSLFVEKFRQAGPFLQAHRGEIFVIHIEGKVVDSPHFRTLLEDIGLMFMLGMKIVLVIGCTHQEIEMHENREVPFTVIEERPITTVKSLSIAMQAAGLVRFQVESILSYGHLPGVNRIGVSSGNYYTAMPFGVSGGIDFMYSGQTRRVDIHKIKRLMTEDVVLLSCIGFSSAGQAYRVQTEELASTCAAQLGASKVMYVSDGQQLVSGGKYVKKSVPVVSLTLTEAKHISMGLNTQLIPEKEDGERAHVTPQHLKGREVTDHRKKYGRILGYCVDAVTQGVNRAHIVSSEHGALLEEIFTPEGSGLLISKNIYSGFRRAKKSDLSGILDITTPLVRSGVLKERSKAEYEKDLKNFVVVIRDGKLVACGLLKQYGSNHAEIGCLAVHPSSCCHGLGEALLGFLERVACASGLRYCFVLSTSTMTWFMERGYNETSLQELPSMRQELYNWKRNPKVYCKHIEYRRTDMEELFWHQ